MDLWFLPLSPVYPHGPWRGAEFVSPKCGYFFRNNRRSKSSENRVEVIVVVQSLYCVQPSVTPWTVARQPSLPISWYFCPSPASGVFQLESEPQGGPVAPQPWMPSPPLEPAMSCVAAWVMSVPSAPCLGLLCQFVLLWLLPAPQPRNHGLLLESQPGGQDLWKRWCLAPHWVKIPYRDTSTFFYSFCAIFTLCFWLILFENSLDHPKLLHEPS